MPTSKTFSAAAAERDSPAIVPRPRRLAAARLIASLDRCYRRFGLQPFALARQGFRTGHFPIARRCPPRKRLPTLGPVAERIAVPGRRDSERWQAELFPDSLCLLHILAPRQG